MSEAAVAETRRLASWLGANAGWLGALLLTITVVAKVAAVARVDYTTASGVIAASDKTTIVLGTLTQLLPALALGMAFGLTIVTAEGFARIEAARRRTDHTEAVRWFIRLVAATVIFAVPAYAIWALVPWTSALTAAALIPSTFFVILRSRRRDLRPAPPGASTSSPDMIDRFIDRHPQVFVATFVLALAGGSFFTVRIPLSTVLSDRMWLPAEVVSPPGEPPWIGYRVSTEADTALYLRDDNRRLVRLPASIVQATTYCTPPRAIQTPSLSRQLSGQGTSTPICP